MRVPQPIGNAGSLKWIQRLVEQYPDALGDACRAEGGSIELSRVRWVSPRRSDDWAEYRDADFLSVVGRGELTDALAAFWPPKGPQWDALGVMDDGHVVLVEAKAHVSELSSRCAATSRSRQVIDAALRQTASNLGVAVTPAWTDQYYQYANRLAHLHFFKQNRVPTQLLFVYFYGDQEMGGPASAEEWKRSLAPVYTSLGIDRPLDGVVNAYVDVSLLLPPA